MSFSTKAGLFRRFFYAPRTRYIDEKTGTYTSE